MRGTHDSKQTEQPGLQGVGEEMAGFCGLLQRAF
jgi:hypothetical protein